MGDPRIFSENMDYKQREPKKYLEENRNKKH